MIKYFGTPLQAIKSKLTGKIVFVFDSKGEYFTNDNLIIERADGMFDKIEIEITEKGKKEKKTFYNPPVIITKNIPDEEHARHCIKCDFSCDFQADMLQHYRKFHQKVSKEV